MLEIFFILVALLSYSVSSLNCDAYDKVNCFIASGGLGYGYGGINPGAQLPFSPLRLGPDTTDTVIDISYRHFSGYNYQGNLCAVRFAQHCLCTVIVVFIVLLLLIIFPSKIFI
jgi:hypothetical protein